MRLKLRCVKTAILGRNNTVVLKFQPNDEAYAIVSSYGEWHLSDKADGVYYGPFDVYYFKDCFVSDFDKEEYEKHFKPIRHVKMYDTEGNLIAEAEHGIANFV